MADLSNQPRRTRHRQAAHTPPRRSQRLGWSPWSRA